MLVYYIDYTDRTDADPKFKDMHDKALDGWRVCAYVNKNGSFKPTILYPINVTSALLYLEGFEYKDDEDYRYGVPYGTVRKHIVSVSFSNGDVYSVNVQYPDNYYVLRSKTKLLSIDNSVSYTPTGNYNPATKKYVDDTVSSAIGSALGGSY